MTLQILLLIVGLVLILVGADWLVDGSSAIARKLKVSEFVIGLTIVGFGTSCPELVVSLAGSLNGVGDIAIGNVVGSNIFNTLLILGIVAAISPITITSTNKRLDIPVTFAVTLFLIVLGLLGNSLSRIDGILFLLVFAAYMYFSFTKGVDDEQEKHEEKELTLAKSIVFVVLGLAGLIFGGELLVNNATAIARSLGVSEKFIAITLLAGGTSLPELVTCIVAASKNKMQLALGNILGSNLFNILLILGISSIVAPISFESINMVDISVMLASMLLVWASVFVGKKDTVDRFNGVTMLILFVFYYIWLFIKL